MSTSNGLRMPVTFLPHGGGPWPFVDVGFVPAAESDALKAYLQSLPSLLPAPPKALLVVSAHWEARVPTVMSSSNPPMYYDYGGFPPESYTIQWPAPGQPALAAHVRSLLEQAGFATAEDTRRGYDHGTFVPLKVSWPKADVPVVQLSLIAGLDPAAHIAMGKALAPLRDEGVLIVGSGQSYHNFAGLRQPAAARDSAERFDDWLQATSSAPPAERERRLIDWARAPDGRLAHPREEHLLPLHVVTGAAGDDRGRTTWSGTFGGLKISGFFFG